MLWIGFKLKVICPVVLTDFLWKGFNKVVLIVRMKTDKIGQIQ